MFRRFVPVFVLSTLLSTTSSLTGQECNSQLAGAPGQGGQCSAEDEPGIRNWIPILSHSLVSNNGNGPFPPRGPQGQGIISDPGPSNGPGSTVVNNSGGSVDQATGAYRFRIGLAKVRGLTPGAGVAFGATYRSYLATENDPSGANSGPLDPTGGLWPFGVGWAAGFAGGPLKSATPGEAITYIDCDGVRWTTDPPNPNHTASITDPFGPASNGMGYAYPAIKGWRWVNMMGIWYRELPNRVLIEYEQRPNFSSLASLDIGYRPKRVFKHDLTAGSLVWEVFYIYDGDKLQSVRGTVPPALPTDPPSPASLQDGLMGYEVHYTWTTIATGVERITKVALKRNPNMATLPNGDWSAFETVLEYYNSGAELGQLKRVRYPQRDIRYKTDGTLDAGSLNYLPSYAQKGYVFGYLDTNAKLLTKVSRELRQGSSWAQETLYENEYASGVTWRLSKQSEFGTQFPQAPVRIHTFTYSTANFQGLGLRTQVQWADPAGIKYRFLPNVELAAGGDPRKTFVARYTLVPATGDLSGFGAQTWNFTYNSCTCGAVSRISLPSGRVFEYAYDNEGRLFTTQVRQKAPTLVDRVWSRSYTPWGLPWESATWRTASRLASATQEDGKVWSVTYGVNTTEITAPGPLNYKWSFKEDSKERVTEILEPTHLVDAGSTGANRKVTFSWNDTLSAFQYGCVETVTQYNDAGQRNITLTYDALQRLAAVTDHGGEVTQYSYDNANNLTQILLPSVVSGRDSSQNISGVTISVDYGVDSDVTSISKLWKNDTGASNAHGNVEYQASYNIFGERITEREDAQKSDIASGALWLQTTRSYDAISRLTRIKSDFNAQELEYVLDSFDMIQKIRSKTGGGSTWAERNFDYDIEGNPTFSTDATEHKAMWFYDAHKRLQRSELWGTANQVQRQALYTYATNPGASFADRPTDVEWKLLPNGGSLASILKRTWVRDAIGRVTGITSKDLLTGLAKDKAVVSWNGASRVGSRTDENDRVTTYGYDSAGYLRFTEDPSGNRTKVTRNIENEVTTVERIVQKGAGTVTYATDYEYDDLGRVLKSTRRGNVAMSGAYAIRRYAYDSLGNMTYFLDAADKRIEQGFDGLGRARVTRRYPRGWSQSDPFVTTRTEYHDTASAALASLSNSGDVLGHQYDATNLAMVVERIDHRQQKTQFLYDPLGHMVEKRQPGYQGPGLGHAWTYRYDLEGRLTNWVTGNNHAIQQDRTDPLGRVTRRWHAPGSVGPYGELSTLSLATAGEEWIYDRIVGNKIQHESRTFSESWLPATSSGYGLAKNLVQEKRDFDAFGLLHQESFGFGHTGSATVPKSVKALTHGWSASADTGFRHSLGYQSGWSFDFTPDASGRRSTMTMTHNSSSWLAGQWFYEGGRTYKRDFSLDQTTGAAKEWFRTTWEVDQHGYLESIDAQFGTMSSSSGIYSLTQEQNLEGFVAKQKYTKVAHVGGGPAAGDRFLLDGYDRLLEAKMGVSSGQIDAGYSSITQFDKKIEYALDLAQNRSGPDGTKVTQGGSTVSTNYVLDASSNRYSSVGGAAFSYDGNGNLVWDGAKLFVYDYLDRLCEIWVWTEGTGEAASQVQTSQGKRLCLCEKSLKKLGDFCKKQDASCHGKEDGGIEKLNAGLQAGYDKQARSSSSTSTAAQFLLLALYGYDNGNRRVLRAVSGDPEGARWSTWDGWQQTEEYEDNGTSNFFVRKVFFRGRGLTDTLGFARQIGDGTSGNPYTWENYALIQGTLGKVVAAYTGDGQLKEKYEYDPYGYRYGYKPDTSSSTGYSSAGFFGTEIWQHESAGGGRVDWETGNIYLRNRYLNTQAGRFKTRDPLGAWADAASWGGAYAYGGNSPSTLYDPEGTMTVIGGGLGSDTTGQGPGNTGGSPDPGGQSPGAPKKCRYYVRVYVRMPFPGRRVAPKTRDSKGTMSKGDDDAGHVSV